MYRKSVALYLSVFWASIASRPSNVCYLKTTLRCARALE